MMRIGIPGRWTALAVTLCCLPTPGAPQADAGILVTDVRYWSLGEVTRVAIELTGPFKYRSDRLPNPERLFFDIRGAKPSKKGMQSIEPRNDVISRIRIAETQPGTTRVVLDLLRKAEYTVSQLSNPDRLIVELRASGTGAKPAEVTSKLPDKQPEPAVKTVETTLPAPEPALHIPPPDLTAKAAPPPKSVVPAAPAPTLTGPAIVPRGAQPNRSGSRTMTRVLGLKLGKIVIDPGHGGHDVGTTGPSGLNEKDLVLDISRRLADLLQEQLRSEVLLTRQDDTFIPLEERTRIANQNKADLFLSVHANSSPVRSVAGVETYYLSFTTNRNALELAARENAGSSRGIFDLQELLQRIALRDKLDESREFASRVQSSLFAVSAKNNAASRNRGVKKAPFVVLIGASMPSVLCEIGFLTNSTDEALLKRPEYRQRIAEAIASGVSGYAETLSNFQVAKRD